MKKNFMMTAAMAAVLVSSCSKNEQIATFPHDAASSLVGLDIATGITKTATADLEDTGVDIYYDGGNISFSFDDNAGSWAQTDQNNLVKWDILGEDGKTFYSMHDGSNPVDLTVTGAGASATVANGAITQPAGALPGKDYVFYAGAITDIPTGGDIQATFAHATSKVNIAYDVNNVDYNNGPTAYIYHVKVKNFATTATPTFTAENTVTWATSTMNSAFPYISSLQAMTPESNASTATGYLFPQEVEGTAPENGVLDATAFDKGHVEVLYRFMNGTENVVGFESVQDYNEATNTTTDIFNGYDGPLYVKIGYVFPTAGYEFEFNKRYTLNLNLPGGYVISGNFFTDRGEDTQVPVVSPENPKGPEVEPGQPVVPSPEQLIGLDVTVSEWSTPEVTPDLN